MEINSFHDLNGVVSDQTIEEELDWASAAVCATVNENDDSKEIEIVDVSETNPFDVFDADLATDTSKDASIPVITISMNEGSLNTASNEVSGEVFDLLSFSPVSTTYTTSAPLSALEDIVFEPIANIDPMTCSTKLENETVIPVQIDPMSTTTTEPQQEIPNSKNNDQSGIIFLEVNTTKDCSLSSTAPRFDTEICESVDTNIHYENGDFDSVRDGVASTTSDVSSFEISSWSQPQTIEFQSTTDENGQSDAFGGFAPSTECVDMFNGFSSTVAAHDDTEEDDFGGFTSSTVVSHDENEKDDFGGLTSSTVVAHDDTEDDDFGGFTSSTIVAHNENEEDDFGGFNAAVNSGPSGWDTNPENFDDFEDFEPTANQDVSWADVSSLPPAPSVMTAPLSIIDVDEFFHSTFPSQPIEDASSLFSTSPITPSSPPLSNSVNHILYQERDNELSTFYLETIQSYYDEITIRDGPDAKLNTNIPFESEVLRVKYLKYVLTEKLNEASHIEGVFPMGSDTYRELTTIADSEQEQAMRDSLVKIQHALFESSVNEAMMRIAKQAALAAKAKIAEQAAQQQAQTRGGSILATTRHFLTRSHSSTSSNTNGGVSTTFATVNSGDKDATSRTSTSTVSSESTNGSHIGELHPSNLGGERSGHSSGYHSGDDTGSDMSAGEASGHSEGEVPNRSPNSSSSTRSGSIMKKFLSLSHSRHRSRIISLRRTGPSVEIQKMELNMDSINGGFDEVKWRCAVHIYPSDHVAELAPAQIRLYSYPSHQLLTGKTDKSMLSKFFKPGTVWTIEIASPSNE